jgi:alpha-1,6-mannosyltransferase
VARNWLNSVVAMSRLGLAGSVVLAIASYWVGAVPLYFRHGQIPVISLMAISSLLPRIAFYLGLASLLFAWLRLGRLIIDQGIGTDWRRVRGIALRWAVPLAVTVPIGSRDLWAYAAQSQLVLHHLNPYTFGPSALPGAFSVEVSHRWIDTPAPYGPLWLLLGRIIAGVVGNHVGLTVAVLRMLAVVGLLLTTLCVPILANRLSRRADIAMWLIVANPLTLVLGVGSGHNDLLMVGFMVAGLTVLTGPGPAWRTLGLGIVLLTAATAIKSPAVVAVVFAAPLWLTTAPAGRAVRQRRAMASVTAVVAAGSVGVFAAITAVSGLGLGWVKQINSAAPVVSWMSLPSLAAIFWDLLQGHVHRAIKLDPSMQHFRTAGTVVSVALLAIAWGLATMTNMPARPWWLWRPWWLGWLGRLTARPLSKWGLLGTALFTVVVLGPSVQPWYFCWSLAIVGLVVIDVRGLAVIAGCCVGLVAMIRPNGTGLQMNPVVVPILAGALYLAWRMLSAARSPQGLDVPQTLRPVVSMLEEVDVGEG